MARRRPRRITTIMVGFGCMIALVIAMGLQVRPFTYLWVSLYIAFAVAVLVVGLNSKLEKQAESEHKLAIEAKESMRRLSARLIEAQELERSNLSRELHDQVGQALTAMKIDISRTQAGLLPEQNQLNERLERARKGVEETLEIIRRMSMLLRPSMLDDIGLSAALSWYVKQFGESTGLRVALDDDGSAEMLPEAHKSSLYRIVQEALTNVSRHSGAHAVHVKLRSDEHAYQLEIDDDGVGFEVGNRPRGLGLVGIQERIDEMNGTLNLQTSPGFGTRIRVAIPVSSVVAKQA